MKKRGQASVEYLILIGVMLAFLIPLFYYALGEISTNLKAVQADNTVSLIVGKIDSVYNLGSGNREKLKVTIPRGTSNLTVLQNNTIQLDLLIYGNKTEIFKTSKAVNIKGSLPIAPGTYFLIIEGLDNGEVSVDVKQ